MPTAPLGGRRRNIAMMFGTEKLEWFSYPMVNNFGDMSTRLDRIRERDGRTDGWTDGWTPHDGIGRACIASRGKN